LKMGGRLDGHLVLGHVDGVGEITGIIFRDKTCFMDINGACIEKYLVEKGSIAIDGVSLTLNRVTKNIFQLALIPITLQRTNLQDKKVGHLVNLEGDIIGKYLYKMAAPFVAGSREKGHSGNLSADFLKKHGF